LKNGSYPVNINTAALLSLPPADKLELVELLWDNLGESAEQIPLPDWVEQEALRRRDEMRADSSLGRSHEEIWNRILNRHE
jgi:putative addiction module component (TIGR02574 family)